MKPEFSQYIFEKSSNIKFNQTPSSGSRDVSCGRTEGNDEANIIVAFRSLAKAPIKINVHNACCPDSWILPKYVSTLL